MVIVRIMGKAAVIRIVLVSGAVLLVPLIAMACAAVVDVATFDEWFDVATFDEWFDVATFDEWFDA